VSMPPLARPRRPDRQNNGFSAPIVATPSALTYRRGFSRRAIAGRRVAQSPLESLRLRLPQYPTEMVLNGNGSVNLISFPGLAVPIPGPRRRFRSAFIAGLFALAPRRTRGERDEVRELDLSSRHSVPGRRSRMPIASSARLRHWPEPSTRLHRPAPTPGATFHETLAPRRSPSRTAYGPRLAIESSSTATIQGRVNEPESDNLGAETPVNSRIRRARPRTSVAVPRLLRPAASGWRRSFAVYLAGRRLCPTRISCIDACSGTPSAAGAPDRFSAGRLSFSARCRRTSRSEDDPTVFSFERVRRGALESGAKERGKTQVVARRPPSYPPGRSRRGAPRPRVLAARYAQIVAGQRDASIAGAGRAAEAWAWATCSTL